MNYCHSLGIDPTGLTWDADDKFLALRWWDPKGITEFTAADSARPIVDKNIILYGAGDRYLQLQWWDGVTGRPRKP